MYRMKSVRLLGIFRWSQKPEQKIVKHMPTDPKQRKFIGSCKSMSEAPKHTSVPNLFDFSTDQDQEVILNS